MPQKEIRRDEQQTQAPDILGARISLAVPRDELRDDLSRDLDRNQQQAARTILETANGLDRFINANSDRNPQLARQWNSSSLKNLLC